LPLTRITKQLLIISVAVFLAAASAVTQEDTDSRIKRLEEQMKKMTEELKALKRKELERKIEDLVKEVDEVKHKAEPGLTAGYNGKRFYIKSEDDSFELNIIGRVYLDYRGYEGGDIEPVGGGDFNDTFMVSRGRIGVKGHIWGKPHRFKVEADFTYEQELRDAYFELAYVPWLKFRFGQFKQPFGRERLQSTLYTQFVERSLINDLLTPDRDVGVEVYGDLFDGDLQYYTGVFNGAGINSLDDNDEKEWTYRIVWHPFKQSGNPWFEGFELGHNLNIGNQPLATGIRGRTAGDVDYYPVALRHGTRTRVGVDGAWYIGPFGLVWEYIHVDEHRHDLLPDQPLPSSLGSVEHAGWYVTLSYLLTGEQKASRHVIPKVNFDPMNGGWGAWEIAARYEQIEHQSRDVLFTRTYADPWGIVRTRTYDHQGDSALTLGVNWYLNPNMTFKVSWVHDWFNKRLDAPHHEIDTLLARFQIYW